MWKRVLLLSIVIFAFFLGKSKENIYAIYHNTIQQPIRGIYVKASNTNGPRFDQLLALVNQSELNTVVIDIKDDERPTNLHSAKKFTLLFN